MLSDLTKSVRDLLGQDSRPIVVYSAMWPLIRASSLHGNDICAALCDCLLELSEDREALLMPTFTAGYVNGFLDLNHEPSRTGSLSEYFRRQNGVRRTVSAFFSFGVSGPANDELVGLRPRDAWGVGSLYEWMHDHGAHILTIGLHPTHCSYSHYAEWVMRMKVSYRYQKTISGVVVHEGQDFRLTERLYARELDSAVANDFTKFLDEYKENGMKLASVGGVCLSTIGARRKLDVLVKALERDAFALVARPVKSGESGCEY